MFPLKTLLSVTLTLSFILFGLLSSEAVSPPTIPSAFSDPDAEIQVLVGYNQTLMFHLPGAMYYDDNLPAWGMFGIQYIGETPLNFTMLSIKDASYQITNGLCRAGYGGNAGNFFSWLPFSKYQGEVTYRNRQCGLWELIYKDDVLQLCVDEKSFPVYFFIYSYSPSLNNNVTTIFSWSENWNSNPFNQSIFDVPASCGTNGTVCQNDTVVVVPMYVFHTANDFTLNNTNVADLIGDTAFVCISAETSAFSYFEWISHWEIQLNASFGQYALCNFGDCEGGSDILVGREASYGVTANGGQCTPNTEYGNWFSLPTKGLCSSSQNIGDNGCTWKPLERVKTINGSCLFQNRFVDACFKDGNFPFPTASNLFLNAFVYDDPSQGGCPNIAPSTTQAMNRRTKKQTKIQKEKLAIETIYQMLSIPILQFV